MCAEFAPNRNTRFLLYSFGALLGLFPAGVLAEGPGRAPLEFGGVITGVVTEADGLTPIENATVSAYLPNGTPVADAHAQTWEDGTYFLVVPADQYLLDAYGPGGRNDRPATYCNLPGALWDYDNMVQATLVEVVASDIVFGIDFRLVEIGYITGHVFETDGSTPIGNATVTAEAPDKGYYRYGQAQTDAGDGTYTLSVPAGEYVLDAWGPSNTYFTQTTYNDLPGNIHTRNNQQHATRIVVEPDQTVTGIDFELDVGGTITGTVTDTAAGEVDNITVQAFDENGMHIIGTGTDGEGNYRMNVAPGSYYVNARAERNMNHCLLAPVTFDDDVGTFESYWSCTQPRPVLNDVDVALLDTASGIDFELPPGGSISGTVRNAATGKGIRGVWVHPRNENGCMVAWAIQTDADGEYTFCGLKPGDYLLDVRPPDYSGYACETYEELRGRYWCGTNLANATLISLDANEAETDIDFTLERLLALNVRPIGEPDDCIVAGTALTVDWTSSETAGNVTLELVQGDEHRCQMGSVPVTDGTFTWTVPTNIGDADNYIVRGTLRTVWYDCANDAESQTGFFCITGSTDVPTLTITESPGGATLTAGTPQLLEWTWTDVTGDVNVVLISDDQSRHQLGSVPVTEGELAWTVPLYLGDGGNYTIRLETYDGDCLLASDECEPFSITGSSTLTLDITEPAGSVCLTAGSDQVVRWSPSSVEGWVDVYLYNGGEMICLLEGMVPLEDGELPWTVPQYAGDGTDFAIRINWWTAWADPSSGSTNSQSFCIEGAEPAPTITITAPPSTPCLVAGETVTITWQVNPPDTAAVASIQLADVDGQAGCAIGVVPLAAGAFDWTVSPFSTDGNYEIQVGFWACPVPWGVRIAESRPICISGGDPPAPTITVTAPTSSEVWHHNCEGHIEWTIEPPEKAAGLNVETWLVDTSVAAGLTRLGTAPAEDGAASFTVPTDAIIGISYVIVAFEGSLCEMGIGATSVEVRGNCADFDGDCDVDLGNFSDFAKCFNAPNRPPRAECEVDADFDDDSDVDLADFAVFAGCFNGPNRSPAASCTCP
ncbi:MAG: carboxypeptidase regulatory-like domain-containing protein [Phycisphaerae bacterium]|nr:carboxypeptidase regulatory-like domain-containing protein [Phycisphaerae bacterium]